MLYDFKTKLPACFQNYRGLRLSVHSCIMCNTLQHISYTKSDDQLTNDSMSHTAEVQVIHDLIYCVHAVADVGIK